MKYYYISLKWTHKDDHVFTLWSKNSIGYTYDKNYVGSYDEEINNDSLRSVLIKDVEDLFEYKLVGDQVCKVLVNNKANRNALGILKKDLNKLYSSGYGYLVYKDAYEDIDKVHEIVACIDGKVNVSDSNGVSLITIERELVSKNRDMSLYRKIVDVAKRHYISIDDDHENNMFLNKKDFKNLLSLW